jgi:hypothetical protein
MSCTGNGLKNGKKQITNSEMPGNHLKQSVGRAVDEAGGERGFRMKIKMINLYFLNLKTVIQ